MNKKRFWHSFSFNIAIIVLTIIGLGLGVIDAREMHHDYAYTFKYFTVLSNIFLCISCIIMLVYQILILAKKKKMVPNWVNIMKLSSVVVTTITMLVVLCFLLPISCSQDLNFTPAFLFKNSNAIFHLVNPVLGILTWLLLDNEEKTIKLPQTLFALIFVGAYEIFYTLDVYLKFMPDGEHDWYKFVETFGDKYVPIMEILFVAGAFGLSWLLWFANRKINVFKKENC